LKNNAFLLFQKSCTQVTCDFIITNQAEDKTLRIYGRSRVFDEYGNEYSAVAAKLGIETYKFGGYIYNDLISGIPTKAQVSFLNFPEPSEFLTILELDCSSFKVQCGSRRLDVE